MRPSINHRALLRLAGTAVLIAALAAPSVSFAFQSLQKSEFGAGVVVGGGGSGAPELALVLNHTPLMRISDVTRLAIIQGEAGNSPKGSPSFAARISFANQFQDVGKELLRVRVRYRITPPGKNPEDQTVVETDPLFGPDPMAFAFQLPSKDMGSGNAVDYQVITDRIDRIGGVIVPIDTVTYPPEAKTNPNAWVHVGVVPSESQPISADGGRVELPDGNPNDDETLVDIPAHYFDTPTLVSLNEVPLDSPSLPPINGFGTPVSVYQFSSDHPLPAAVRMTFLYPDFSFDNGGQRGLLGDTGQPENRAGVVAWDGTTWRKIGGMDNSNGNTVTIHSTGYPYFAVVPAGASLASDARPAEKIITPNGDNKNDEAVFMVGGFSENVNVDIFDINGHKIRGLSTANPRWDGRDDSGKIVESGVYLYQYKVNGETISGLIGVAK